jgi:hypothetical protein
VVVEAFIGGGASGGLEDVEDAASAVVADILTALAGGPTLGGIVWDLDAVDADPAMAPAEASDGMAVVRVTATYSWEERI